MNKITRFYKEIPECQEKPFVCGHLTCKLWGKGYRVSMRKFLFLKWLIWEQPSILNSSTELDKAMKKYGSNPYWNF